MNTSTLVFSQRSAMQPAFPGPAGLSACQPREIPFRGTGVVPFSGKLDNPQPKTKRLPLSRRMPVMRWDHGGINE